MSAVSASRVKAASPRETAKVGATRSVEALGPAGRSNSARQERPEQVGAARGEVTNSTPVRERPAAAAAAARRREAMAGSREAAGSRRRAEPRDQLGRSQRDSSTMQPPSGTPTTSPAAVQQQAGSPHRARVKAREDVECPAAISAALRNTANNSTEASPDMLPETGEEAENADGMGIVDGGSCQRLAQGAAHRGTSSELETDSLDEEVELMRFAAEIGTTSADDDLLTTETDWDEEEDGLAALPCVRLLRPWQQPGMASVVIEEDEEDLSSLDEDGSTRYDVDSSEVRSRLWAQSLLRLKRSIDEIHLLCEFESDEALCQHVHVILETASKDFSKLLTQLHVQQEYALLGGDYPFTNGIAWTTRTPRVSKAGESVLEQLDRVQGGSPGTSSTSGRPRPTKGQPERRARSFEPSQRRVRLDDTRESEEVLDGLSCGGTGEALGSSGGRCSGLPPELSGQAAAAADRLDLMVESALERVQSRLGRYSTGRLGPEEVLRRSEDRQRRAQQSRASQDDQKMVRLQQAAERVLAARERRQERAQQKQRELLEKMTKARRQYQDHLREIWHKARKENRKTAEVTFIAKEALKSERDILTKKHEAAHVSRKLAREQMRKKLHESGKRVSEVSENRRRQWESWQMKVQQGLEEKDRQASQRRRDHITSIRLKSQGYESRSELVRGKRRELQEEDERSSQDFLRLRGKHIGKLALDCEGLPDGVREEVAEQLHGASGSGPAVATRKGSTSGHAGARQKGVRSCTPPPKQQATSLSPKNSPHVQLAVTTEAPNEVSDVNDERRALLSQAVPALPRSTADLENHPSPAVEGQLTAGQGESLEVASCVPVSESSAHAQKAPDMRSTMPRAASARAMRVNARGPGGGQASLQAGAGALACGTMTTATCDHTQPRASSASVASDGSEVDTATDCEAVAAVATEDLPVDGNENDQVALQHAESLRGQLASDAMPDEDALRLACGPDVIKAANVNAANRARILKLSSDLSRYLGTSSSSSSSLATAVAEESTMQPQSAALAMNFERIDSVLDNFCKVLSQSQREADYALVLKQGCAKVVFGICMRIKDALGTLAASACEKGSASGWRQASNVMVSALKWFGLLCKQQSARVFLLLTGRAVLFADLATACLDVHFGTGVPLPDAQSAAVLFLPQTLHVLSQHVKQSVPESAASSKQALVAYLLVGGLSASLRDLFRQVEIRGLRHFDSASPMPLLLLRAMGFLAALVSEYRLPATESCSAAVPRAVLESGGDVSDPPVLRMLRRTELFGIVSILISILLAEGRREKSANAQAARLPQTVTSLSVHAVKVLNHVARLHLATLQETLGACRQQELYHLLVCLLDYSTSRTQGSAKVGQAQQQQQEETELLHETIILLGHYCLQRSENQSIMCYGEGQTLLTKITSLPLHYFMDERGKGILFPTILATCFGSEQNLTCLKNEMNLSLLRKFLLAAVAAHNPASQADETRPSEAASTTAQASLGGRFPPTLCEEALAFFSEEGRGVAKASSNAEPS